jgi:predicted nucleotidyltransferase
VSSFVVLIGSYARGDFNEYSDCDVFRVGCENINFDFSAIQVTVAAPVTFIDYDKETFSSLYEAGSLFIYHVLHEGQVIYGDKDIWNELKNNFVVQRDFRNELEEITLITNFLANTEMFGGKFLMPLVNAFTEIKNASIFFLAHRGQFVFEKTECMRLALASTMMLPTLLSLKKFYDYSVRGLDLDLPFDPNSSEKCSEVLLEVHRLAMEMKNACQ